MSPAKLGVKAYVEAAVRRARTAKPGTSIPLHVTVRGADVRAWVAKLADRRDREVRDARVVLSGAHPRVVPERNGYRVRREATVAVIVEALLANRRGPVKAVAGLERPKVASAFFTSAVVIRRGTNKLLYYKDKGDGLEKMRTFSVATGTSSYPTPLGNFEIVQMQRHPWWYPPPSTVGRGSRARAARAWQPARHAVDGHQRARRRHPRHARRGIARLLGLPRLHSHGDPLR